jgi:diadenosine tetraphosphate (Ap4A) HIT family hydrolase
MMNHIVGGIWKAGSVLLAYPRADSLNALSQNDRAHFLLDMSLIGDAIQKTCAVARTNYSIMMNTDHYLHAHIRARYDWEPNEYKSIPVWSYPEDRVYSREYKYDDIKHGALKKGITESLMELMNRPGC